MMFRLKHALLGAAALALVATVALAATQTLTLGTSTGPGGIITLFGSTSGSATIQTPAVAGTGTIFQLPATNGTNTNVLQTDGSGVTSWVAAGTGNCTVSGSAGIVSNTGSSACSTDTSATLSAGALSLGASGTAGSVAMGNATSGTVTLQPVTGALGSVTASLPANTGTVAELNLAQTWSAVQTLGARQITPNNALVEVLLATGTSVSLTGPREYFVCTGTCTVTPPVPVAGYEFCVMNDDNVATVITMAALGSSARYEATARTSYGTAGTGTFVSGGAVGDKVCLVGRDSTHYLTVSFNGTWTAN